MKKALALILAAVMILGLAACGNDTPKESGATKESGKETSSTAETTKPVEYKEEAIIGTNAKVSTLDIQESCTIASGYIYLMTHEPLVHYYEGQFIPKLAERYESEGGRIYTFYLRKGVKFHDGSDFTADDVLYTCERAKNNATNAASVRNMAEGFESVVKKDDYTVVITLKEQNNDFLIDFNMTGSFSILSKTACEKSADGYKVGTGPWVNDEFFADDHISVVRNENYWGEKPVTKKVTFKYIPEASARLIALENHEIDVCIYPDSSEYGLVEANKELGYYEYTGGLNYLYFNIDHAPVDDVNFRLALAYATDVQELINGALGGYGIAATSTNAMNAFSFFDDWESVGLTKYSRDLDKAKEYLAKSAYPNGATITIQYTTAVREIISQILQKQWEPLGVTVVLDKTDSAGRSAARKADDWQSYLASVAYTPAGQSFKETFTLAGGTNQMGWTNERVEELFNLCASETSDAKRLEMYKEINTIIHKECPALPLYYGVQRIAYNNKVSGINWESRGVQEFMYIKVEK